MKDNHIQEAQSHEGEQVQVPLWGGVQLHWQESQGNQIFFWEGQYFVLEIALVFKTLNDVFQGPEV